MKSRHCAAAACLLWAGPAFAAETQAHAMVVDGRATLVPPFGCTTSGPQPIVLNYFNTGIGLPVEGYSYCGLTGGIDDSSSTTGPSTAHQDVGSGANALSGTASAGFDHLSAGASGGFTGASDSSTFHAAEAAAFMTDSLMQPGTGDGFITLGFSIDGTASIAGNSQALTIMAYQFGGGPVYDAFIGNLIGNGNPTASAPTSPGGVPVGFTVTPTTLSGSAYVTTFRTPITLGVPFDFKLGLYTAAYPGPFTGVVDNDFLSTVRITSVEITDAQGKPLDVDLTSASGTIYDAMGAHLAPSAVPESASWAMMIGGVALIGGAARRRRIRAVA